MSVMVRIEDFASYVKRDLDALDAYTAQLLLDGAEGLVTEYCGWHVSPEISEQVDVDGTGTAILPLPTLNLISLDSVSENGRLLDVAGIDWSVNGLLEKRHGGDWTGRRRGVSASITHGYAATPGWLVTMICALAGRAFTTSLGNVVQETAGGESISYARGGADAGAVSLAVMEMRMLDRIRVPSPI